MRTLSLLYIFITSSLLLINLSYCSMGSAGNRTSIHPRLQGSTRGTMNKRLASLLRISYSHLKPKCNHSKYLVVSETKVYGNSGNHMIQFTHGLWVTSKLNMTFVVPNFMKSMLDHFDLEVLHSTFCFCMVDEMKNSGEKVHIFSKDIFFAWTMFNWPHFLEHQLPKLTIKTLEDLSIHFVKVYAGLWSSPKRHLRRSMEYLIENYFDGNFDYTSVHKRNLEGKCSKILADVLSIQDFSPIELPMYLKVWKKDLTKHHPICHMSAEFILETKKLNNQTNSKIFVAHDGQEDVKDLKSIGAIFGNVLDNTPYKIKNEDKKFFDMMVAIHGKFFILNPRSTFSWEIYVIRICLGLIHNVPILKNNDVYVMKLSRDLLFYKRQGLWVSWTSVVHALQEIHRQIAD